LVTSVTLVAVIVATPAPLGAVNVTAVPEALVFDENWPPAGEPVEVKAHVTPAFAESPVTVALTDSVCVIAKPPRTGVTVTAIAAATIVTVADPDFVVSATEVAVTVIPAGFGTVLGAV